MYQIDVDTATNTRPAATSQGAAKWFTDGTPGVTPATIVPAEFLNMIMAEMMNVLVAGGVSADKAESDQVATAIQNMIDATRIPVGSTQFYVGSTAPNGWVEENGGTIGSASSGATTRANADTLDLYTLLWNTYDNTALVIQSSSGSPTTRGASAAADFAANKRMPLFDMRGEFARGWDNGRGVDSGRALGSYQGSENLSHDHTGTTNSGGSHTHTGTTNSNGDHSHTVNSSSGLGTSTGGTDTVQQNSGTMTTSTAGAHTHSFTTDSGGSHTHSFTTAAAGVSESRPRNRARLAIIKL